MWVVYTFIGYLVLALLIPTVWALWPTWHQARRYRQVMCPAAGEAALISLDPWFAVRMHVAGRGETRVRACERWPEHRNCSRECVVRVQTAA